MATLSNLIDQYLEGARQLREAVSGMTREQVLARPIPGKWSTLEVVCHLSDFDPIHADRMKRIIAEDRPTLIGADENCFAAALAYQDRDIEEELTIVSASRSQLAKILHKLPEVALARTGNHNERGLVTLEDLLTIAIGHFPHHIKFIGEKRKALGVV